MPDSDLQLRRLVVRNYRAIHALDIDLPGNLKVLCLVGPNGAGKSALISLLAHAVCQLTHESIADCEHDRRRDGSQSFHTSLLTSEIGDRGQSCGVRSDWSARGSDLSHRAFVRRGDHPRDEYTERLIHEMGLPADCKSYFRWRHKPPPEEDSVARSVLLLRPSRRFERLAADRPCYEDEPRPTADELLDVAAARTDLHPSADVRISGRRFLPVCPQSGLRHMETVVASIGDGKIDFPTRRWAERVTTALCVLRDKNEDLWFELRPDGAVGIRRGELRSDGSVGEGRWEALSLLSAAEADVLVTVGHIALQQLYLARKFGAGEESRFGAPGWVFIDAVDANLHPSWQDKVVPLLRDLFSEVRYVVTTQSPFVIRSLPREGTLVVRLPDGKPFWDSDFAAMDIESILRVVFDVKAGWNEEIEYELQRLESYSADLSKHAAALSVYRELAKRSQALHARCEEIISAYGTEELVDEILELEEGSTGPLAERRPR